VPLGNGPVKPVNKLLGGKVLHELHHLIRTRRPDATRALRCSDDEVLKRSTDPWPMPRDESELRAVLGTSLAEAVQENEQGQRWLGSIRPVQDEVQASGVPVLKFIHEGSTRGVARGAGRGCMRGLARREFARAFRFLHSTARGLIGTHWD